ncbi:DUF2934 domain-containing protein [Xanthobacter versatilis]|uniref:DUF2934 domain-containing protein n=1 Tax=Xanthobacter autotrophicus (strain ATCC BAA-1158 / Py2) TaxID=78245 RepID=UPI00372B9D13
MPHTTQLQTNAPAAEGLTTTEREQISRRARALWQEEGFPQGRDRELWAQAELQVLKGRTAVRDGR